MFNRKLKKEISKLRSDNYELSRRLSHIEEHVMRWDGVKVLVAANEHGAKYMPLNRIMPSILEACCLEYEPSKDEAVRKKKPCKRG